MLLTACLLAVLALYAFLRVLRRTVVLLGLDPWDALVYLGLAEHHVPPPPRRVRLPSH